MRFSTVFRHSEKTMKKKLVRYMLSLAAILLIVLLIGLFLFGQLANPKQQMSENLEIQMNVFARDVENNTEEAIVAATVLSRQMSDFISRYEKEQDLPFSEFSDHPAVLAAIQEKAIDPLSQVLKQVDCSGAFFLLEATVNSHAPHAEHSRTGLYLQKADATDSEQTVLLYRGNSEIGKKHGIMPHRKWRLEFRVDLLGQYDRFMALGQLPLDRAYSLSDLFILPGTSEKARLLIVPIRGTDGTVYGICGFEISQSYFQIHLAQSTNLPYLTCMLTTGENEKINADQGLSCGIEGGYYFAPKGQLESEFIGSKLLRITGGTIPYIGLAREVTLTPNDPPFKFLVLTPKHAYDRMVFENTLQIVLLVLLLLFFAVSCSIYFSSRFLAPVLRGFEQIKASKRSDPIHSDFQEIDDLFGFLAQKDEEHEKALIELEQEKKSAEDDYEKAQTEIARLAYARNQEIDPDEYQVFLEGLHKLTPTEQEIFNDYLAGYSVKEILNLANIKETTLRYHNRNIYSKLGVNSLKQLLRFATLKEHSEHSDSE